MSEIIIYKTPDNQAEIEVTLDADTIWLSQYQMADLFQTDRTSILKHIQNMYTTGELDEISTSAKFAQVRKEGKPPEQRSTGSTHYFCCYQQTRRDGNSEAVNR